MPGNQGGKQVKNRVCCYPLENSWKIMSQLKCTLVSLSLIVLVLVCGIVGGNIMLTEYLVIKSSTDALNKQLNDNLDTSQQLHFINMKNYFQDLSYNLKQIQQFASQSLINQHFPIVGYKNLYDISQNIPENQQDLLAQKLKNQFYKSQNNLSMDTMTIMQDIDSGDNSQFINALSITSQFLKSIYQDFQYTGIYEIFVYIEDQSTKKGVVGLYPAGLRSGNTDYGKKWLQFKNEIVSNQSYLTQPFVDDFFGQDKSFVNYLQCTEIKTYDNKDLKIFTGYTIELKDLENKIMQLKWNSNSSTNNNQQTKNIIVDDQGLIYSGNYKNLSEIEEISTIQSKILSEGKNDGSMQQIVDDEENQFEVSVQNLIEYQKIYFLTYITHENAFKIMDEIDEEIEDLFVKYQIYTMIGVCIICFILITGSQFYIKKLLKPFQILTEIAEYLGGKIDTLSVKAHQERDNKQMQVLDDLIADDIIGDLIQKYQELRKGLQGNKKKASKNEENKDLQIEYPNNLYKGTEMKWLEVLDKVQDHNLKNNNINQIVQIFEKYKIELDQNDKKNIQKYLLEEQNQMQKQNKNLQQSQAIDQNQELPYQIKNIIKKGQKEILKELLPTTNVEEILN